MPCLIKSVNDAGSDFINFVNSNYIFINLLTYIVYESRLSDRETVTLFPWTVFQKVL